MNNFFLGLQIAEALEGNTHVKKLEMVNCKLTTPVGDAFAK